MRATSEQLQRWCERLADIQDEMGEAFKAGAGKHVVEASVSVAWAMTYNEFKQAREAERHPVSVPDV